MLNMTAHLGYSLQTKHLAVAIMDQVFSKKLIPKKKTLLIVIVSIMIAAKT